jgi:hypothetical protein
MAQCESNGIGLCQLTDVGRSSPLAEDTGPGVSSAPATGTKPLARAPSTPSSVRSRLLSPNPFNQLTRKLSLSSPLSARSSRAALHSGRPISKLAEFNEKMNTPPTPETVRRRRGFRPLSIVTSALFPFDFNPLETMEDAQNGQLALPSPSKGATVSDIEFELQLPEPPVASAVTADADTDSDTTPSPSRAASIVADAGPPAFAKVDHGNASNTSTIAVKKRPFALPQLETRRKPAPSIQAQIAAERKPAPAIKFQIEAAKKPAQKAAQESAQKVDNEKISVAEYLRRMDVPAEADATDCEASMEANKKPIVIEDKYPQFYNLPPPDPKQHPAYRTDPFNCTDEPRLLTTNWTKHQIKQWQAEKYLRERNLLPDESPSKLKRLNPFNNKSPEKEKTTILEALAEDSPVKAPASIKPKTPQTPGRDKLRVAAPPDYRAVSTTSTPVTDGFDKSNSGGLRSLSNLFKTRSSIDKASNASTVSISSPIPIDPSIEVIHPAATPELKRYDLVSQISPF